MKESDKLNANQTALPFFKDVPALVNHADQQPSTDFLTQSPLKTMEIDDFLDVDNIDPLQLDLLDSVSNVDPMSVVSVGRPIHHQFKTPDPPISSHPKTNA